MAAATSTINAAVTALVAAITASVNDTSVLVTEGPPSQNQPDDFITVGERISQTYTPHAMVGSGGSGFLHEEYDVFIHIDVYRGGDSFSTVRSRCLVLSKAVDDAVRNDPSLGLSSSGLYLAFPQSHIYEQTWDEDHKGTRCTCDLYVHCQAIP